MAKAAPLDAGLVAVLGLSNLVPAFVGLYSPGPAWTEYALGIAFGFAWIATIHFRRAPHPFTTGFLVGTLAGGITALVQAGLVRTYLDRHPELVATNPDATAAAWQLSITMVSLLGGLVAGVITGSGAWFLRRGRPRAAPAASGQPGPHPGDTVK